MTTGSDAAYADKRHLCFMRATKSLKSCKQGLLFSRNAVEQQSLPFRRCFNSVVQIDLSQQGLAVVAGKKHIEKCMAAYIVSAAGFYRI